MSIIKRSIRRRYQAVSQTVHSIHTWAARPRAWIAATSRGRNDQSALSNSGQG